MVLVVKNSPANAGDLIDTGSIPGLGRSPGGGHGNPFQYSCLENPMDKGAWWATVHRVAKSWTPLSNLAQKDVPHVLIPRIHEYVSLHGKRDFAGVTKIRVLRWGD